MKMLNEMPSFMRSVMPVLSRLAFSPFIVVVSRPLHLLALIHHFMTHSLGAL
jgi:hypothetical protein